MKLGEKIRTLKGYKQETMADALKLSVTGYGKIERDETDVTISRITQIAEVLGVRVEDILRFEETVSFHNYSGSNSHNFGQLQNYHNHEESLAALKALYENRINRLEEEAKDMRKLVLDLVKKRS